MAEVLVLMDTELAWIPKRNRVRCLVCKDVIESKSVHDFVTCKCGSVSVDGGQEYFKRCGAGYKEMP